VLTVNGFVSHVGDNRRSKRIMVFSREEQKEEEDRNEVRKGGGMKDKGGECKISKCRGLLGGRGRKVFRDGAKCSIVRSENKKLPERYRKQPNASKIKTNKLPTRYKKKQIASMIYKTTIYQHDI